ncbi:MAG: TetR/AcrR family transcriptional regulator [Pseudomonadota bacterium]
MARTQSADYDKKRQALTDHAAKLFARHGFAGASISDLAAVCGVSKSLIYHYYSSKEAILFAVMEEHIDELLKISVPSSSVEQSATDELIDLTKRLLRCYVGAADRQKILLYDIPSLPKAQQTEIKLKQRELIKRVESIVLRVEPGLLKKRAQLRVQIMLYFGMINWTHTWYKPSGAVKRDTLAEMAANTLLKSL